VYFNPSSTSSLLKKSYDNISIIENYYLPIVHIHPYTNLLVPLHSTGATSMTAVLVDLEKHGCKVYYHVYSMLYLPIIVRV